MHGNVWKLIFYGKQSYRVVFSHWGLTVPMMRLTIKYKVVEGLMLFWVCTLGTHVAKTVLKCSGGQDNNIILENKHTHNRKSIEDDTVHRVLEAF